MMAIKELLEGYNNADYARGEGNMPERGSGDYITLGDGDTAYWNETGKYHKYNDKLWAELVPESGNCKTIEGELLRAGAKIYYRRYNDGDVFSRDSYQFITDVTGKVPNEDFHTYDELMDVIFEYILSKNGQYEPNSENFDWIETATYGMAEEFDEEEDVECSWCDGQGSEQDTCDECGGSGYDEDDDTCGSCQGDGTIEDDCNYCGGTGYE